VAHGKLATTGSEMVRSGPRTLWLIVAMWSLVCFACASWWLRDLLHEYRADSAITAKVRLGGARDTLSLSFRQLAALPQNLSHRPGIAEFMAFPRPGQDREMQTMLSQTSADFALPLVALIARDGTMLARSRPFGAASGQIPNLSTRDYFARALTQGAAIQFMVGPTTQVAGLFVSSRAMLDGQPAGVVMVKQATTTLNRLLGEPGGAAVLVTDANGVVALSNRPDMLLKQVPGGALRTAAQWQTVYQRAPEPLTWQQTSADGGSQALLLTRLGDLSHVTLSTDLGDGLPFKVWVLEPLTEEAFIAKSVWTGATLLWSIGCVLIWLSWRRVQLIGDTVRARRDLFELTQALPLTVFRYVQPLQGEPRFAFIGGGVDELLHVDAGALERDPLLPWRLADGGDRPPTHPHEFRVTRGEQVSWLLADSTPKTEADGSTTYNGYWLDITSRRETRARFMAVFEYATTSYLFFDARRGVTHCNPATLRLFGTLDAQSLLGRILWFPGLSAPVQADGQPSKDAALASLREHTATRQRVRTFEWRFQRADGSEFDAEVSVIALDWSDNAEFCAVIQDVSVRKQMHAELQRARDAAEAASQTKSSFLANMSHELRTPMNAIIGMTYLALDDGLPPRQRDYVEKAHSSARNLLQILNDILDVSKIEAGQLSLERIDFELETVVSDMADILGLKADEKGLELLFSASADLPPRLVGDPSRLRQVLVNLGGNAVKFTETGEVTVGMDVASEDAHHIELHGWIRDTGVGLSEAEIDRIFQPFMQADSSTTRRYGGTGLGLVISRQLVERMGGRLWVESQPGRGSTFHFTARFERSIPRAPSRAWMADELRGRRALLVDDNAAALDVLGRMLETLGVVVDRADSAEQALALIERTPEAYTWLLIDWKMPGMDGIECAREIIRRHPQIRPCLLLVTGFARDDAMRSSVGLPLAGILNKPITPSSLHDCLVQARRSEPARPTAAPRAAPVSALAQATRRQLSGARVLLVEDHPLNQQLACELLRRAGVDVVVANDGREALERLAADGPFDGVLMDCQMPVMDGYTATRELRRNPAWQQLPVIAMTASALEEDRQRALASGMNAHITKPIHVETMLGTMAAWIVTSPGRPDRLVEGRSQPPRPPTAVGDHAVIDRAVGLELCMGNEALYAQLLAGFREAESDFVDAIRLARAEQRHDDALRRTHDMRGLSATLGARSLHDAVGVLHLALRESPTSDVSEPLDRVAHELRRVLGEIAPG
jgi:PAS domain S-box-containing protein